MDEREVLQNALMTVESSRDLIAKQGDTINQLLELAKQKEEELQIARPKAESFDDFISRDKLKSMKDVSDLLAMTILVNGKKKVMSRNEIYKMLVESGNVQDSYTGYKPLAIGREHGLVSRVSYDVNGKEHNSVLANHRGVEYISKLAKKYYEVVL